MPSFNAYHAAVEVKYCLSLFLRTATDLCSRFRLLPDLPPELGSGIEAFFSAGQKILDDLNKVIEDNRPEIKIPEYADRGIDEFWSSCDSGCGSGGCGGGGGGGCGGCSGGC